ncbi:MAG: autotransporter-associated beta strand repeat-containing protein, partial [Verrucomicrobiota bacterium]
MTGPRVWAASIASAGTGSWGSGGTWVGGVAPVAGDDVTIASGHTVTLTAAVDMTTGSLTNAGTLALGGFDLRAGALTGAGAIGTASGTPLVTVGGNNASAIYAGVYSGTGARLRKEGSGTLTLTGANTYAGGTTIAAGTLQIGNNGATGSIVGNVVNDGVLIFNRTGTVNYGGVISGSGSLTKLSAGTLVLQSVQTYTGSTTLSSGILRLGVSNALPPASAMSISGGTTTLDLAGYNQTLQVPPAALAGIINNSAATGSVLTIDNNTAQVLGAVVANGAGGGGVSLVKAGSGLLQLRGASTYTGATTVLAGSLQVGDGSSSGSIASGTDVSNSGTLIFSRGGALSYTGVISGPGALVKEGPGVVTLGGANTYTGSTTINGGALAIPGDGGLGTPPGSATAGHLTLAAGDLQATATFTLNANRGIALGAGVNIITVNSAVVLSYGGILSGAGSTLRKDGAGELVLGGANTHTGVTTVNAGTLTLGAGGTSGSVAGGIQINAGCAVIFNRSDALTYSGVINGPGTVTKQGAGTLTLTGVNTWTGATTVAQGTLRVGGANERISNNTAVTVAAGAVLDLGGRIETVFSLSGEGTVTSGAAGTAKIGVSGSGVATFSGVIQNGVGTVGVVKQGTGTQTLSGPNSYTGNTTISAGILVANNATALGLSPQVTISGSGTLRTDVGVSLAGGLTISASTAKFNCNGKNSTSGQLILGVTHQPAGTHGSSVSGATYRNDSYFTSTASGVLSATACPMILEVVTTLDGQTVTLPIRGTVSATVHWGDGSNNTFTSAGLRSRSYATAGTYTVSIYGTMTQFGNGTSAYADAERITRVVSWGCEGLTSLSGAFRGAVNLTDVPALMPA